MAADQPNRTRRYVYGGLLAAAAVAIGLALVFTVGQKKDAKAATAPSVASLDDHTPIEDVLKDLAPKPEAEAPEHVAVTPVAPVVEEPAPGVATGTFTSVRTQSRNPRPPTSTHSLTHSLPAPHTPQRTYTNRATPPPSRTRSSPSPCPSATRSRPPPSCRAPRSRCVRACVRVYADRSPPLFVWMDGQRHDRASVHGPLFACPSCSSVFSAHARPRAHT